MKKFFACLLCAALAVSMTASTALARGGCGRGSSRCRQAAGSCAFVDADGDGICDLRDSSRCPSGGCHRYNCR